LSDQKDQTEEPVFVAAAAVGDDRGIQAEAAIAAQGSAVLLVARFADQAAAADAYEALREAEAEKALKIDGVLVADADGYGKISIRKLTDHHTRKGTAWGALAGAALAVIFPPSIIAGAVAGGAIGAVVGKGANLAVRNDVAKELADVLTPNSSGIVAVMDVSAVEGAKEAMPQATEVKTAEVDAGTAEALKTAADAAEGTSAAG
jgi:uncharacterized membrane protein